MPMVPSPDGAPRLADVLASSRPASQASPMPSLPAGISAVVVLADGLGAAKPARAGHARYLASRLAKGDVARSSRRRPPPGSRASPRVAPGYHGLVGYRVLDADNDRVVNQLNGWDDDMRPESWQPVPTLFEQARKPASRRSRSARRVMRTRASAMRCCGGPSTARPAPSPHGSLRHSASCARRARSRLRLRARTRQAAHAHGWHSDRWVGELEELDAELATFAAGCRVARA